MDSGRHHRQLNQLKNSNVAAQNMLTRTGYGLKPCLSDHRARTTQGAWVRCQGAAPTYDLATGQCGLRLDGA